MATLIFQAKNTGFPSVRNELNKTTASMFGLTQQQVSSNKQFQQMEINAARLRERSQGVRREVSLLRNDFLLGAFAVSGFTSAIMKSVTAASKYQSSITGLNSVALNTGNILNATKQAALDLSQDGLLTLTEASAGLKNLLATGFGLERSINLMKAFKDFSAFNRQGALGFGEAIIGATEGLKNQNSMLVDNVGLTKNLSVIMKEYGYRIQDLGDESKKSGAMYALYYGLLKESSLVTGDAEKVLGTYTGRMSQFEAVVNRTNVALGNMFIESGRSPGVFNEALTMLNSMSVGFKDYLEINRDLIKVKIKSYFEELVATLKGLGTIATVAIRPFMFLFDFLGTTGLGRITIFALTIRKLSETMKHFMPEAATGWYNQITLAGQYGANVNRASLAVEVLAAKSKLLMSGFAMPNAPGVQRGALNKLSMINTMGALPSNATELAAQQLKINTLKSVIELESKSIAFQNAFNSATVQSLPLLKKQRDEIMLGMNYLQQNHPKVYKEMQKSIGNVVKEYDNAIKLNTVLSNQTVTGMQRATAVWVSMSASIGRAAIAMKGFIMANLPLIAIYGTVTALSWAWEQFNKKKEQEKQFSEQTMRLLTEESIRRKDIFENRVSELKSIEDKAKSYKELNDKVGKTSEEMKTMVSLEADIRKTFDVQSDGLKSVGDMANFATKELRSLQIEHIKNRKLQIADEEYARNRAVGKMARGSFEDIYEKLKTAGGTYSNAASTIISENLKSLPGGRTGGKFAQQQLDLMKFTVNEEQLGANLRRTLANVLKEIEDNTKLRGETTGTDAKRQVDDRINALLKVASVFKELGIEADLSEEQIKKLDEALLSLGKPAYGKDLKGSSLQDLLLRMRTERDVLKSNGSLAESFAREQGKFSGFELDYQKIMAKGGKNISAKDIAEYNNLFDSLKKVQTEGLLQDISAKLQGLKNSTLDFEDSTSSAAFKVEKSFAKQKQSVQEYIEQLQNAKVSIIGPLSKSEIDRNTQLDILITGYKTLVPFYRQERDYLLNEIELKQTLLEIENKRKSNEEEYKTSIGYGLLKSADKITGLNVSNLPNLYANRDAEKESFDKALESYNKSPIQTQEMLNNLVGLEDKIKESNRSISDSFAEMALNSASAIESLINTLDVFGTKTAEIMSGISANREVDLALQKDQYARDRIDLMNQYENKNLTYEEYAHQESLLRQRSAKQTELINIKARLDEKRANDLRVIDQKIAIGQFLETEAIKFSALALAYGLAGVFSPWLLAEAGGYAAAAAALGGAASAYGTAGLIGKRAGIEAEYRKNTTLAERNAQVSDYGVSGGGVATDSGGRSLGGTITAQELKITIAPVITIEGQTIIMSNVGIQEASMIMGEQTVKRIQDAINNKELTFANVS